VITVVTHGAARGWRILVPVPKRLLVPALAAAVGLSVLAFVTLSPVLAAAVTIGSLTLVAVAALSADWEKHPSFEERERARSLRRKEKWERNADARARDRARYEAYQEGRARKAR
jgi:ribulose kinase